MAKVCRPTVAGPAGVMMDIQLSDKAVEEIVKSIDLPGMSDLAPPTPNSAPFMGVKLGSPPKVDVNAWTGERFNNRKGHVTIVPSHEKDVNLAQKQMLSEKEIKVELVKDQVTWLRGVPANAAAGCKAAFYCNVVLSPDTVEAIKAARKDVGLPELPPPPPQAVNRLDADSRLGEFKFHVSITTLMPTWADEIDDFKNLDAAQAQEKMVAIEKRITDWASQVRIVPTGLGNALELTKTTGTPIVVGPTMIVNMNLSEHLTNAARANLTFPKVPSAELKDQVKSEVNSSPYKGAKMGSSPMQVDDAWDGTRFPHRPGHVTLVPFNEFKSLTDAQKETLRGTAITVEVDLTQQFYLRGSPGNAAGGCKGMFYVNWVLTDDSIENLKTARINAGLPALPPAPPQAVNALDQDERLKEFHFHQSLTSLMPGFADEIDAFGQLDRTAAQEKMAKMEKKLEAWASQFRIVPIPRGRGNVLEVIPKTVPTTTQTVQSNALIFLLAPIIMGGCSLLAVYAKRRSLP